MFHSSLLEKSVNTVLSVTFSRRECKKFSKKTPLCTRNSDTKREPLLPDDFSSA
ncbi:hypothetical protein RUMHYD_01046 [Blautia hydrogenotrophica DSM 10507]|uniref:Uncharacterized protein n=1 Tax=Blautia hydrogenotrophica (strain DSM 10507 / JCM 14656 / S5a33) TaxID=476272 RepID=C0CJM7_BLAHS|nr:hypothetical protein RUMHYD_01046 [Blautia hydrogenotrophica DSM 10507]